MFSRQYKQIKSNKAPKETHSIILDLYPWWNRQRLIPKPESNGQIHLPFLSSARPAAVSGPKWVTRQPSRPGVNIGKHLEHHIYIYICVYTSGYLFGRRRCCSFLAAISEARAWWPQIYLGTALTTTGHENSKNSNRYLHARKADWLDYSEWEGQINTYLPAPPHPTCPCLPREINLFPRPPADPILYFFTRQECLAKLTHLRCVHLLTRTGISTFLKLIADMFV